MYSSTVMQYENPPDKKITDSDEPTAEIDAKDAEQPIIWFNVFGIAALHVIALYSFIFKWHEAQLYTWLFSKTEFLSILGLKKFDRESESSDLDKSIENTLCI